MPTLKSTTNSFLNVVKSSLSALRAKNSTAPIEVFVRANRSTSSRRIDAIVDGKQIYFLSPDTNLNQSMEGLGSAFLIPALHANRDLHIHGEVCNTWAQQVSGVPKLLNDWWQYSNITLKFGEATCDTRRSDQRCLAFSGGVDSFYTLLKNPQPINALVTVLGYDVKLKDRRRCRSLADCVSSVAALNGLKSIKVSSNLRRHPLFKKTPWERSHGGAIIAIGHLLSESFGTLVISSSVTAASEQVWGSRWDLDPMFGSDRLKVEHFGETQKRLQKLISIANEPIVRSHLRVCWVSRDADANCCECEKCVRTMLILDVCQQLGKFTSFPRVSGLVKTLDGLAYIPVQCIEGYETLLKMGMSVGYQSSVQRLLERSKKYHGVS